MQDIRHSEWYIGEHSRQAVEEALMKEGKVRRPVPPPRPHLAAPPRLESLHSREVVIEKGISNRALDPRLGRVPFQLRDFHMFLDIVRCRFLG